MPQLPFDIPQSLASYAEHFEEHPQKATERLEKQLAKRGPDAVGYLLLAWFFFRQDKRERAIELAIKARIFAPGSPFLQKFHYYLSHPDLFDAWTPDARAASATESIDRNGPILDLDSLIEKLSKTKAQKIKPEKELTQSGSSSANINADTDGIYSETLAKIYEDQGKLDTAIHSYQQLKKIKPEKDEHFNRQIDRLQELMESSEDQ